MARTANYTRHFLKFNTAPYSASFDGYDSNFRTYLPENRDAKLLDFGCGIGNFLAWLKHRGYTSGEGVDVSDSQVEYCHSMGIENAFHAERPIEFLLERPRRFNVIFSMDVFEHLPTAEVLPTLGAIYDALLPGGKVVLRVPNIAAPVGAWARYMDFTHHGSFSDRSIQQVLEDTSFEHVSVVANRTHYNRRWLGAGFEVARWFLYKGVHLVYFLQLPGSVLPKVYTVDMIASGTKLS